MYRPGRKARLGPYRVIAARLPADMARKIRTYAAQKGVTLQSIIKEALELWLKVNFDVNHGVQSTASVASPAIRALPVTAEMRQDAGLAAPVTDLLAIDVARHSVAGSGTAFTD
jgi:hypothetical protein